MKVVIVNRHRADAVGGSELQSDIVARGLQARGHEIVYVAVNGHGKYSEVPYDVVPIPLDDRRLARHCIDERPAVVYWRLNKHALRHVAKAVSGAGIPFVFAVSHINDVLRWGIKPPPAGEGRLRRIYSSTKRRARAGWQHGGFRWVDAVICQTQEQFQACPVGVATVIPNSLVSEPSARFEWSRPYVAWIGSIKPSKRPETCLELARTLAPHRVDVLMAGEIQDRSYRWLEQPDRLPANLHYLGGCTVEKVNGLLEHALALVHTGLPEGFPNVFIQAWAAGIPTVSLEADPSGIIRRRALGVVTDGDMRRLHDEVVALVEDPDHARRIGRRARALVHRELDPQRNVARLEEFLLHVATSYRVGS